MVLDYFPREKKREEKLCVPVICAPFLLERGTVWRGLFGQGAGIALDAFCKASTSGTHYKDSLGLIFFTVHHLE